MEAVLLVIHIACGAAGLGVGPVAMGVRKRRGSHTRLGLVYQALTFGMCSTAIGLVLVTGDKWFLAGIALATEAAALAGWQVRRRARRGWLPVHIGLVCGSYVSFVTAFLVVNFPGSVVAWVLPTIVASPLIARASARAARPRRPARSAPTVSGPAV